jgi:hypothetical protein
LTCQPISLPDADTEPDTETGLRDTNLMDADIDSGGTYSSPLMADLLSQAVAVVNAEDPDASLCGVFGFQVTA